MENPVEMVKVDQKDSKGNKELVFKDFVRFAKKATHGIGRATESEAKELLKKLTKTGYINVAQEEKLLSSLLGRMKLSQEKFEERVAVAVQTAAKRMVEVASKEVSRIETQILELEKKIEKNSKKSK